MAESLAISCVTSWDEMCMLQNSNWPFMHSYRSHCRHMWMNVDTGMIEEGWPCLAYVNCSCCSCTASFFPMNWGEAMLFFVLCYFGPLSQLTLLHSCCSSDLLLSSDSASINVACGTCPQMNPSEWFLKFSHFWESFYSHSSTMFPWVHLILWCTSQIVHHIGFSQSTCESYSVHHPSSLVSTLCFHLHYVECTLLKKQCHWAIYEPASQHP